VAEKFTGVSKSRPHPKVMFAGQVMKGFSVSSTVTVKLQLDRLPEPSVAVQFTVVVPFWNREPEVGLHTTFALPELSVVVTV